MASGSNTETGAIFGFTFKTISCSWKFYVNVYNETEIWTFRELTVLFDARLITKYGKEVRALPYFELTPHVVETTVYFISSHVFFLSKLLLVPAAKRGTSLGLPRVFFFFFNFCRGLQPLDVVLDILDSDWEAKSCVYSQNSIKLKAFTFYPWAGTSIRS